MALATSEASARVGRGFSIMDSSICVAVMTGLRYSAARRMMCFWIAGTFSGGTSTPRSPRATMMASATSRIESRCSTACGFSSLAMIQTPAHVAHIRRSPDERNRHRIDALSDGKDQVFLILLGKRRDLDRDARKV